MSVFTNPAGAAKEAGEAYTKAILQLLGKQEPMAILENLHARVVEITRELSDSQLRAPENPGKWSIIEVVQHLADTEVVWAWRLRMVVAHDEPEVSGYDQDLWAQRLNYRQTNLQDALHQIKVLRAGNLRIIRALTEEDMNRVGIHVERGPESIAHMLKLYAGHDLVHLRQIERIWQSVISA